MSDVFTEPLVEALGRVHVFEDLSADQRAWLAARMEDQEFQPGTRVFSPGAKAEHLAALVAGEIEIWQADATEPMWIVREGDVSGKLPFSRMVTYSGEGRPVRRSRIAWLHQDHFPDLLRELPDVCERLVWLMADRIREVAVTTTHKEKLAALGKLSAGLAHELNNPATAVQRAADQLCTLLTELQTYAAGGATPLAERLCAATEAADDPIARSDRQRRLRQWARTSGFDIPRDALAALADAGLDAADVAELVQGVPPAEVAALIVRITMAWRARTLVGDIAEATRRIADLVAAIKEYAYRDETPTQDVDVRQSLERTLTVFTPRLKHGVVVERAFEPDLPTVQANASELTQVWTNLLDNALDAMADRGTLRVGARREDGSVLIEIGDSGPGIPEQIQRRVFEPFFTTKAIGQGTGLGLDIVRAIVGRHRGAIRILHSRPGDTVMQVRLPA